MTSRSASPRSALLLAALLSASLAACGGSSSSSGTTPPPGGGGGTPTPSASAARGQITAVAPGVITVNGVALSIASASVKVEKQAATEDKLKVGMVVEVKGKIDDRTGTATEVRFEDSVQGKVTGKTADSLEVGGHHVGVDDTTHFDDSAGRMSSVSVGQRVRISGLVDDKGGLRAARVDRVSGSQDDFELKGFVSGLSAGGFTLKSSPADSGYTVTLASGVTLPAGVVEGSYVEVRSTAPISGTAIVASSVSLEDAHVGAAGEEVEVEGLVASGSSAAFSIGAQAVTTSATTTWENGVPADLLPGVKVEAEGKLDSAGVLAARKVSFRATARLYGTVSGASIVAGVGTLQAVGVPVQVTSDTRLDSGVSLADGQLLEIRGIPSADGTRLVATRVRTYSDNKSRPQIQGPVSAKTASSLTILGVTVDLSTVETGGLTDQRTAGSGSTGPTMNLTDFLAAIETGRTIVKAKGKAPADLAGTTLHAAEAELEGAR